jgi:hypothetical protein
MLATLTKETPLTRPMSIARRLPPAMTAAAAAGAGGMASVVARSLAVPSGRMPTGLPTSISASMAALRVPSPPPMTMASADLASLRISPSSAPPSAGWRTSRSKPD